MNSKILAFTPQEGIGNLKEDSGTVTGHQVTAYCTSMQQVLQDPDAFLNNVMGLRAINICNKSDTATVVLIAWII